MTLQHKVAIITGANTGIGFAIAERLLRDHCGKFTVVLACRNLKRAENAREKLSEEFPGSDIEIVQADMESVSSVFRACDDIKKRFTRLDLLFCNAGILLNEGLRWGLILRKIFTDIVDLFESDATIQRKGEMTADGLGKCFECNLFGHYLMLRELEDLLSASDDGRVVWTSSMTSEKKSFSLDDFQGIRSDVPYESSKWATDLVSVHVNERLNPRHVRSFTTDPGVVASGIGNLAMWIVQARKVVHYIVS
ncbi:hypothetical protein BC938DRAFT_479801 [Jimgerdemannia flammicorona]|uniref:Uncharacterized protein n=1 Tax=Jimgerdemannia flammicorona TaxID=994334 RepID=A0A433QK27_9FUNG|nr:hypothetical protein BC938DRAFT_479801 [Jimgerdemannia flammicorona]